MKKRKSEKALKSMGGEAMGVWRAFGQMDPCRKRPEIIESTALLKQQNGGADFRRPIAIRWSYSRAGGPRGTAGRSWPSHVGTCGPKGSRPVVCLPRVLKG